MGAYAKGVVAASNLGGSGEEPRGRTLGPLAAKIDGSGGWVNRSVVGDKVDEGDRKSVV